MLLGMLGLAFLWLAGILFTIFEVCGPALRRRRARLPEAIFRRWFVLGFAFLFICFELVIVMALTGWIGTGG